ARTQCALFAACCTPGPLALCPEFYELADPYLLEDVVRYRACAVAVRHFGERLLEECTPEPDCAYDYMPDALYEEVETPVERVCPRLRRWRDLYSITGHSYRSLNQTLDDLPGGLSHHLIAGLPGVHLERAVTDRVELAVLLLSLQGRNQFHQRVFHFA